MPLSVRSVALNGGSVVVGLVDGFLLLWTITFMASALDLAFAKHYWFLGLLVCLVALVLVVALVLTASFAGEGNPQNRLSVANYRRVAAYLLAPLILSAVVSSVAWGVTAGVTGSIF